MNALQGELGDGVLANLLQYLALNQVSGCLTVRHPQGARGEIFFEQGRLVHARSEPHQDLAALALLISWVEGSFGFRDGVVAPERSLRAPLETLLLRASFQADRLRAPTGGAGEATIGGEFVRDLTRLVIDIMGPMGEIVVEDALYDLGLDPGSLPRSALAELLDELAAQFRRDDWQQEFRRGAERLSRKHKLVS